MSFQVADIPRAGLRSASTALLPKRDGLGKSEPGAWWANPVGQKHVGKEGSTLFREVAG